MSDLGLHCLPLSLLWDAWHKWVKGYFKKFSSVLHKIYVVGSITIISAKNIIMNTHKINIFLWR